MLGAINLDHLYNVIQSKSTEVLLKEIKRIIKEEHKKKLEMKSQGNQRTKDLSLKVLRRNCSTM